MPCACGWTGGYPQSKWVAEKVLLLARKLGLPVSLYRPGYGTVYDDSIIACAQMYSFSVVIGHHFCANESRIV